MSGWGTFWQGYGNTKSLVDEAVEKFRQGARDNALRQYAMNPNDPGAVNALATADPALAIQIRQQQAQAQTKADESFRDSIKAGGDIIRRIQQANPQMPKEQVYALARDTAVRMRIPGADQAPAQFDEQYYNTLLYASDPARGEAPTSLERNYDFYKRVRPELADQYLRGQAEGPPIIQRNEDGTTTVYPRSMLGAGPTGPAASTGGGPKPGDVEDGYRFKGGDPARSENWEPVNGGPTPQASGSFLR